MRAGDLSLKAIVVDEVIVLDPDLGAALDVVLEPEASLTWGAQHPLLIMVRPRRLPAGERALSHLSYVLLDPALGPG